MKVSARLKRLERGVDAVRNVWAVFSLNYYECIDKRECAQGHLINAYLSKGNRPASCYFFINEIPCQTDVFCEEKFLYAFTTSDFLQK